MLAPNFSYILVTNKAKDSKFNNKSVFYSFDLETSWGVRLTIKATQLSFKNLFDSYLAPSSFWLVVRHLIFLYGNPARLRPGENTENLVLTKFPCEINLAKFSCENK